MSDIVERLRYVAKIKSHLDRDKTLIAQAADEIEQLVAASADMATENERLRAALKEMQEKAVQFYPPRYTWFYD